jgi:hypothetical protein
MRTANAITHDVSSSLSGIFEVGFALSVSGPDELPAGRHKQDSRH